MVVSGQLHAPATLPSGKSPPTHYLGDRENQWTCLENFYSKGIGYKLYQGFSLWNTASHSVVTKMGQVARVKWKMYTNFSRNTRREDITLNTRRGWEDNIKIDVKDTGYNDVD
jgi:hypothetical protein